MDKQGTKKINKNKNKRKEEGKQVRDTERES